MQKKCKYWIKNVNIFPRFWGKHQIIVNALMRKNVISRFYKKTQSFPYHHAGKKKKKIVTYESSIVGTIYNENSEKFVWTWTLI